MNRNGRRNLTKRLYIAQNGICHLCKKHIDNIRRASLDHIVPKSKGGKATIANLLLAHSICNGIRGNDEIKEPEYYLKKIAEGYKLLIPLRNPIVTKEINDYHNYTY